MEVMEFQKPKRVQTLVEWPGVEPWLGYGVMFLGKTTYSYSASPPGSIN